MRGVISVPSGIIVGKFNIRIALPAVMPGFGASNVEIVTVSGDPLPADFVVKGSRQDYHILCPVGNGVEGESEVRLVGVDAMPVRVSYDTHRSVRLSWGQVRTEGQYRVIPMTFDAEVIGLTRRCFRVVGASRSHLYGKGRRYALYVMARGVFTVKVARQVCKHNGKHIDIEADVLEVR